MQTNTKIPKYQEPKTQPPPYDREKETLRSIVDQLNDQKPSREALINARRQYMKLLYNGGHGLTLEAIGDICGISKQAVQKEISRK